MASSRTCPNLLEELADDAKDKVNAGKMYGNKNICKVFSVDETDTNDAEEEDKAKTNADKPTFYIEDVTTSQIGTYIGTCIPIPIITTGNLPCINSSLNDEKEIQIEESKLQGDTASELSTVDKKETCHAHPKTPVETTASNNVVGTALGTTAGTTVEVPAETVITMRINLMHYIAQFDKRDLNV